MIADAAVRNQAQLGTRWNQARTALADIGRRMSSTGRPRPTQPNPAAADNELSAQDVRDYFDNGQLILRALENSLLADASADGGQPPAAGANTGAPRSPPARATGSTTSSTATGGSSTTSNTTPVAPPQAPAAAGDYWVGRSFDEFMADQWARGRGRDPISYTLVAAPNAAPARAGQVARVVRDAAGRVIEIVNYGSATDGPNVAQGDATTTTAGGASQNIPPNTQPNSNGGTVSTGGASSGNSGSDPTGGTSSPPPGNGGAPRTPDTTSLVNNDGSNRVPGSPPNMPPPSDPGTPPNTPPTTTRTPPPAPPVAPPRTPRSEPIARGAPGTGRDSGTVYDPNITVLVDEDSGQAPTPALTPAQINAARAALNRNMVAGGVQTRAKGPDAANHVAPSAGATVSTAAPTTGHTPPGGANASTIVGIRPTPPANSDADFNRPPAIGGVCHDYVLDRLGVPGTPGQPYRAPANVTSRLDALGYGDAGPHDRLPPGTVIQWGTAHVGLVGPDGRIYHYTQAAPDHGIPARINVVSTIDDVTNFSRDIEPRQPFRNQPVRIRVPPPNRTDLPHWIQQGLAGDVTGSRNGSRPPPAAPPTRTPPPAVVTNVPATPPVVSPPVVTTPPVPPPADMRDVRAATTGLAPNIMNIDKPGANAAPATAAQPTGTRPQNVYDPNVTVQVNGDSGQAPTPALTRAQIDAARAALNRNMVAGGVQTLAKGPKGTDADHHHDAPGSKPDEKKPHPLIGTWDLTGGIQGATSQITIGITGGSIHVSGTSASGGFSQNWTADGSVTGEGRSYKGPVTTNVAGAPPCDITYALSEDGRTMTMIASSGGHSATSTWRRR